MLSGVSFFVKEKAWVLPDFLSNEMSIHCS